MKQIFFLLLIINALSTKAVTDTTDAAPKQDTVIVMSTVQHPTAQDSLIITQVVNGIKTVVTVFNPEAGNAVNHVISTSGIVGLICAVWRFFEKRKLRKKGKLTDGK